MLTWGSMDPAQVTSVQQSVCTIKSTSLWFYSVKYRAENQVHNFFWIMFC